MISTWLSEHQQAGQALLHLILAEAEKKAAASPI